MPNNAPPSDIGDGLRAIVEAAASSAPPQSVLNMLGSISTILNAAIGLAITLVVVTFFVYLIRWVVASDGSEEQKIGARGVLRAMIALFLGINIWWIMRLLSTIVALSPVTEYALFIGFFILLTCWSLFGIADGVVVLIAQLTDRILDGLARLIQSLRGVNDPPEWSPRSWSKALLRVGVLGLLLILSLIGLAIDF